MPQLFSVSLNPRIFVLSFDIPIFVKDIKTWVLVNILGPCLHSCTIARERETSRRIGREKDRNKNRGVLILKVQKHMKDSEISKQEYVFFSS